MEIGISGIFSATDQLNEQGGYPHRWEFLHLETDDMAVKESTVWSFLSGPAQRRMNEEISAFWRFCFYRDLAGWRQTYLGGGAFLP